MGQMETIKLFAGKKKEEEEVISDVTSQLWWSRERIRQFWKKAATTMKPWRISRLWTHGHGEELHPENHNASEIVSLTLRDCLSKLRPRQLGAGREMGPLLNAASVHTVSFSHGAGLPAQHRVDETVLTTFGGMRIAVCFENGNL